MLTLTSDWLWQDHKERCIYTRTDGMMTGDSSGHQWANGNCATALGVICEAVGQVRTNQNPAPGHGTPVLTSDWSDGALHHGSAAHPAAAGESGMPAFQLHGEGSREGV